MKLNPGDYVQSARAIPVAAQEIFSISEDGYGKLTRLSDFNVTNTNTKGVRIQKSEQMADFISMASHEDILINSTTTQIRIKYTDIPLSLRDTQGVRLIKLTNNHVIGISIL